MITPSSRTIRAETALRAAKTEPEPPIEPLWTAEDATRFLRCTKQTLYNLMTRGVLVRADVPFKGLRFLRRDVEALVTRNGSKLTAIQVDPENTVMTGGSVDDAVSRHLREEPKR